MNQSTIEQLRRSITVNSQNIAVIEAREQDKSACIIEIKENIKEISIKLDNTTKNIENRFTYLDEREIKNLTNNRNMIIGIIISIATGIIVPVLLHFIKP